MAPTKPVVTSASSTTRSVTSAAWTRRFARIAAEALTPRRRRDPTPDVDIAVLTTSPDPTTVDDLEVDDGTKLGAVRQRTTRRATRIPEPHACEVDGGSEQRPVG